MGSTSTVETAAAPLPKRWQRIEEAVAQGQSSCADFVLVRGSCDTFRPVRSQSLVIEGERAIAVYEYDHDRKKWTVRPPMIEADVVLREQLQRRENGVASHA